MTAMSPSEGSTSEEGLLLPGLDGANPVGFLAALGVMEALDVVGMSPRMTWILHGGSQWRPALSVQNSLDRDTLISKLLQVLWYGQQEPTPSLVRNRQRFRFGVDAEVRYVKMLKKNKLDKQTLKDKKGNMQEAVEASRLAWLQTAHPALMLGDNTNVKADRFREHLTSRPPTSADKRLSDDMMTSLGTELPDDRGIMQDTALRTMSGSGHQHFLRFASNLLACVNADHLNDALFHQWEYCDPVRNLTLRIDPIEDARYALRWGNPSTDNTRDQSGNVLGANALAVFGMAVMPTVPASGEARTVGFKGRGARATFWRWPIWTSPVRKSVVKSFLSHPQLFNDDIRMIIQNLGVATVYQSQRLTVGKYRNFTPAQRVA